MPFNIAFLALNVVVLIWHFAITHRYRLPRGPAWLRLLSMATPAHRRRNLLPCATGLD